MLHSSRSDRPGHQPDSGVAGAGNGSPQWLGADQSPTPAHSSDESVILNQDTRLSNDTTGAGASAEGTAGGSAENKPTRPLLTLPVTLRPGSLVEYEAMAVLRADGSVRFTVDGECGETETLDYEDEAMLAIAIDAFLDYANKLDLGYSDPIGAALVKAECRVCDLCGKWFDTTDGGRYIEHGPGWVCDGACLSAERQANGIVVYEGCGEDS